MFVKLEFIVPLTLDIWKANKLQFVELCLCTRTINVMILEITDLTLFIRPSAKSAIFRNRYLFGFYLELLFLCSVHGHGCYGLKSLFVLSVCAGSYWIHFIATKWFSQNFFLNSIFPKFFLNRSNFVLLLSLHLFTIWSQVSNCIFNTNFEI